MPVFRIFLSQTATSTVQKQDFQRKQQLGVISRGPSGRIPKLGKQGNHISEEVEETIEHLLEVAEHVEAHEHSGAKQGGGEGEAKSETAEILQELNASIQGQVPGDQVAAMLNAHHDQLVHSINEVAESMDVEDALAAHVLLTTGDLDAASQLPDTPERTNSALANKTVQADMVAEDENQLDLLQQAVNSSARFLINFPKWEMPIRYCFDPHIAPSSRVAFQDAVQHFENRVPCLQFEEIAATQGADRCSAQPAIYVQSKDSGCYANVGKMSVSKCNLEPHGCDTLGVAAHELGHNLGMLHEQSRSDASQHVRILWENIQPAYQDQYVQEEAADVNLEYDIMSLMHYSDSSFGMYDASGNQLKTMRQKQETGKIMGNRMGLTNLDAKQVAAAYCSDDYTHQDFKVCTNDPDSCTAEECICHQDPRAEDPVLKVGEPGCYKCLLRCPTAPYGSSASCGCPVGCTTSSFEMNGKTYTMCNEGCQDGHNHPGAGAPEPAPPIPPVPAGATTDSSSSESSDPDARRDMFGCLCRKTWGCAGGGMHCDNYCCNPDQDPGGEWCFKEDETCGSGTNWGYCSPDSTTGGSTSDTTYPTYSGTAGTTYTDAATNNNECQYSNDQFCDETEYCMRGTDCVDCGNCDGGEPRPFGPVGGNSYDTYDDSTDTWNDTADTDTWNDTADTWNDTWNDTADTADTWNDTADTAEIWNDSSSSFSSDPEGEPCSDMYFECTNYAHWCDSNALIDGLSFYEACKKTCGFCPVGTNHNCFDFEGSVTCEMYAEPYCDPSYQGFIYGVPFVDACRATCNAC